jgi:Ser/Thr protein kinase RdoA (MazF antagonist)
MHSALQVDDPRLALCDLSRERLEVVRALVLLDEGSVLEHLDLFLEGFDGALDLRQLSLRVLFELCLFDALHFVMDRTHPISDLPQARFILEDRILVILLRGEAAATAAGGSFVHTGAIFVTKI